MQTGSPKDAQPCADGAANPPALPAQRGRRLPFKRAPKTRWERASFTLEHVRAYAVDLQ